MNPISSLVGRTDATGAIAGRALGALVVAFIALAALAASLG
jgi:hypothetical protein